MSALLEVRGLSRTFRLPARSPFNRGQTVTAVDGVTFRIEPGETFGLVGESGCGKSTTAKLALGLIEPTDGSVTFEGRPVLGRRHAGWRDQRRGMQMIYQDPLGALDPRLPVGAQVVEPLAIFGVDTGAERKQRMRELFDAVGLPLAAADRCPHELSGGQRQRVVLARALILNPRLIACDEPISALDVSIQAQVINLLCDIQMRLNIAYLFISHDLKIVRQISHRMAVMYLGRIVEAGEPDRILQHPAHPYTQALVSAVPDPHRKGRRRLVLKGDPPDPARRPPGCSFNPRCPIATEVCRTDAPGLKQIGAGRHLAACHHAGTAIVDMAQFR